MKPWRAHLRYFVLDAVDEWRHSPGVNLLAVTTLAAALFVGGLVLLVLSNLGGHLERWQQDLRIQVYLDDGVDEGARAEVERVLAEHAGVARVEFVDKQAALERFRRSFGETVAGLSGELELNPLPASFEVYLAPRADPGQVAADVSRSLDGVRGVEEVRFDRDWLERLAGMLRVARGGSAVAALVIFGAVVLVMASVLRLAVYARRDEIEIVQLVGATPGFVRGPFVVAGLAQGLAASLAAALLVEGLRWAALRYAGPEPVALLTLVAGRPLPWGMIGLLVLMGLAVGFFGSYFAVRTSLTFE